MKIFSKEQIYEGDKLTAERQNISSTDLMERAGKQIFQWLDIRMQGAQVPIHIFCGIGNNGGDGLVLGRHLITHGYNVIVYIVNYSDKRSKDFLINYERIKSVSKSWPIVIEKEDQFPQIGNDDIIVDAVFGIGLNRPATNWVQHLFQHFRSSGAFTLSVDIPSGMYTDKVPDRPGGVVWANHTLSFQSPKLVFFLPDTQQYTRNWEVLDIGIDQKFLIESQPEAELIGKVEVLSFYKPRDKFSFKNNFGHCIIIGGSYGKIGAVLLSSRAVMASGAGLVSAYVPKCGYIPIQSSFPEAMVVTDSSDTEITSIKLPFKPDAIGIGPGLGTSGKTIASLKSFLSEAKIPLVIDADMINILAENEDLLKLVPENSIFTPHPGELKRLIGEWKDDFEKIEKSKAFSRKTNAIILIKGAHTMIVKGESLFINSTGNQGMATAGAGDVLTGIITGLIGQKYDPLQAALFGVYLHGKAADIVVEKTGYQSLIASDIIRGIPKAYLDLFQSPQQSEGADGSEDRSQKGSDEEE
ncbi:NAD(P)H-hydrate dehydratase [Aegicerativicinus sediminis]|uniref:NAD(P)H-hydrate dehydratase n=1 Tax=Aegicerativicinus sediminis TaxID=2893202 RepID=UPI001E397716|nr:NAD(P)H-hydrate dehydratase [Aegicerativicinus sediminis]